MYFTRDMKKDACLEKFLCVIVAKMLHFFFFSLNSCIDSLKIKAQLDLVSTWKWNTDRPCHRTAVFREQWNLVCRFDMLIKDIWSCVSCFAFMCNQIKSCFYTHTFIYVFAWERAYWKSIHPFEMNKNTGAYMCQASYCY